MKAQHSVCDGHIATFTVKKPRVINAFLSFRNAFMNRKREREDF
jgi:hypothetical protein